MKEWIFSIIVSVLITTIISIICPEGRLGQIIKCIFSIVLVLIVIKPVLNTNKSDTLSINNEFIVEQGISKDYLIYIYDIKSSALSTKCEDLLTENGFKNSNVIINYSIEENYEFNIQNVNVNLSQAVISSNREHIVVIEEIKSLLSEQLNVIKDKVNVYG